KLIFLLYKSLTHLPKPTKVEAFLQNSHAEDKAKTIGFSMSKLQSVEEVSRRTPSSSLSSPSKLHASLHANFFKVEYNRSRRFACQSTQKSRIFLKERNKNY
ncbi:hypothetical protein AABB24_032806, partial [Solanum stoloniferum]